MNLEQMKARLAELIAELRAMHEEAGDAALSEERQADWDAKAEERATLVKDIERAEARVKLVGDLAEAGTKEKGSDKGAPAFHASRGDEVFDLDDIRKLSYSGDDFLERVGDNAKRAIERAKYGTKDQAAAAERAEELLDTADNANRELAKRMLLTGSKEYESGFTKVLRHGSDAFCTTEERQALMRTAQSLGTDGSGGYAVPFQLDPTVMLTSTGVINPIRELARVETIVGKEWQGVTSAGTTVARGAEAAAATASNFTLAQPTLRTNRVQGYTVFSLEIDLSWSALRSEITRMLVDAKQHEENSFITGDGTGTNPGGVVGSADITSGQEVVCATEDVFAVGDLYATEEALDARWEANASWLGHKSVYNRIRQFPTDAAGTYPGSLNNLFVQSLQAGNPSRLLDYPTYRSTAMESFATAMATDNHVLLAFGDFKQFLIVDRIGMTVEMVPTVVNGSGFPTGQRGVYAVWMNNSKILIPEAFRYLVSQNAS